MEIQVRNANNIRKSPVAPIGLIAPPSGRSLAKLINAHLVERRRELIREIPKYASFPGFSRENFELACSCPRFTSGEGKAILDESIRGYDIFLISDVGNYGCTLKLYGIDRPMSPDDHFQDIKRIISVIGRMAQRITVIMPYLYGGRQDRAARPRR